MRDGAFDYLTKPFDLSPAWRGRSRCPPAGARARDGNGGVPRIARGEDWWEPAPRCWRCGSSSGERRPRRLLSSSRARRAPARRSWRGRFTGTRTRDRHPFVAVNLAALPPTFIESELFGHERGAFTGAAGRRSGRFEAAGRGRCFSTRSAIWICRCSRSCCGSVQEGTYERVGGDDPSPSQARIIAATSRPVRPGVAGAALREDLYYRLAVIEIEVPPLRARRSDVPLLVAHALRGTSRALSPRRRCSDWPPTTGRGMCASCSTS
jgi:hypothetical protein